MLLSEPLLNDLLSEAYVRYKVKSQMYTLHLTSFESYSILTSLPKEKKNKHPFLFDSDLMVANCYCKENVKLYKLMWLIQCTKLRFNSK